MPFANASALSPPEAINVTDKVSPFANASAISPPEPINGTDVVFANDTDGFLWLTEPPKDLRFHSRALAKRGGLPPRDRTLADHMENHGEGLPECYKKCMRSEDGKSSIHMGKDTLGQICGSKWPSFAWWSEHHIFFCVNGKNGCPNKQAHRDAYKWLKSTCGDKPN